MKTLLIIISIIIIWILFFKFSLAFFKSKYEAKKLLIDFKNTEVDVYCEQCDEILPKEHTCYTCCNVEITQEISDYGICPTCKEHI